MDKQPEALRLADLLEKHLPDLVEKAAAEVAAELRRLHQSEQEGWRWAKECEAEVQRLKEIIDELENDDPPIKPDVNQELVNALKYIEAQTHLGHIHDTASSALARHKEQV